MADKKEKGISRRDFMKGATATTLSAVALTALGGCVKKDDTTGTSTLHPWETPPAAIKDSDIVKTYDTEVVVVGAGYAGVAAACSAAEHGAKVICVEKTETYQGRGVGGTGVTDSKVMRDLNISLDKPHAVGEWIRACGNRADEKLISLFFNKSGEAMDWLIDKAEANNCGVGIWNGYSKSKLFPEEPTYHMVYNKDPEGKVNGVTVNYAVLVIALLYNDALKTNNCEFHWKSPAYQLIKEDEKIVGVICSTDDGYVKYNASKAVILATGDISGDTEMTDYYSPIANKAYANLYTPVGANSGDGHKMGMWAGAQMQEGELPTMMHPQACSSFHGPFMFVNPEGKRSFNEDTWVQGKSLGTILQGGYNRCYSIFDGNYLDDLRNGLPYGGGMFWDTFRLWGSTVEDAVAAAQSTVEDEKNQGVVIWSADTIEGLADMLLEQESETFNKDEFLNQVSRYNTMCDNKEDTDFFKQSVFLTPIRKGPFYAAKVGPGLLAVVGGLKVNTDLQCLDESKKPISGLYAVGNVSGDVYALDYPISIPGNSHGRCLTWGYLVGKTVSEL